VNHGRRRKAFDIITDNDVIIGAGLESWQPAIALHEGKSIVGQPKPSELDVGAKTRIKYPLVGGSIEVNVVRVE
jgi:hypothetical protein